MRCNKKAFGGVVSTLIMFIAVVGISTGLVISFKNYVADTQSALNVQNDVASNKLNSAISISNIYYNSSSNETYVYVKNIGQIKLVPKDFDLFLDNAYTNNFSYVYADDFSTNMTLFQPGETMSIIYAKPLLPGTHDVKVVTGYSSSSEDSFNI